MGILSDLNRKRKKAQDKLKDEFLGFTSSVSRKFVPRELRPALPFLSAAIPFMLPTSGIFASPLGRALLSSGANLTAQGLADPEAEELNLLSAALAGAVGAGTAPGASEGIRGLKFGTETTKEGILNQLQNAPIGAQNVADAANLGPLARLANVGIEGVAQATDFLGGIQDSFSKFGKDPGAIFSKAGAKELGKAVALPASQATGDLAYTEATKALREFNATEAAELAQAGADAAAIADARRNAIRYAMEVSGFEEDEIMETFDELGLKDGGRVGLQEGGILRRLTAPNIADFQPFLGRPAFQPLRRAEAVFPRLNQLEQGVNIAEQDLGRIRERLGDQPRQLMSASQGPMLGLQQFTPSTNMLSISEMQSTLRGGGDLQGMKDGGIMDLGGKEMDLRGGGFVPIGKKERADDVPARLSKNEFVMTADAVRAAGGGSVNKGAQRMYDLMNNLEARA